MKRSVTLAGIVMLLGAGCGTQVRDAEAPDAPPATQETTDEEPTESETTPEPEPMTDEPELST